MSKPVIAGTKPCYLELTKGRSYLWCRCGRSKRQPFCDGSHIGTDILPLSYQAKVEGEEVLFCTCKLTKDGPHCDGSHNNLLSEYGDDDPGSDENLKIKMVAAGSGPLAELDDGCYVFSPARRQMKNYGSFQYSSVISRQLGAQYQSMFYAECNKGTSPVFCFEAQDCILYISHGSGKINIAGVVHAVSANAGLYVRSGEAFQVECEVALAFYLSVCPGSDELVRSKPIEIEDGKAFDQNYPTRIVKADPTQRQSMADRYFQLLVDKTTGSTMATQFIGHIPISKAEPHRHLYEEALIILSGEGVMWTDTKKAPVHAGDVIFLPRKVTHSLQSTQSQGMDVVGVIYPGDNPSINY